ERMLVRDLYDIYFLHTIAGKTPDLSTLKKRLLRVRYTKNAPRTGKPDTMGLQQLCKKLREAAAALDAKSVAQQLGDYLDPSEYIGLEHKIKIGVAHLVDGLLNE
ncbi:MAG: hypothetical protein HY543_05060, partial [Deltaproteobacteria bacterium]|nr:hypothetical protein [Deltaproteobacteria bacterium]